MNESRVGAVARLLDGYRQIGRERRLVRDVKITDFLARWQPCYDDIRKERTATAARFNVFHALGVAESELRHSAFLAYLLDPSALHDQGYRFLGSFLEFLKPHGIAPGADGGMLNRARVHTEFDIGDHGRIDIVVFLGPAQILAIENKVWAGEQKDQVNRYQVWIEKQTQSGAVTAIGSYVLFLTPDGRPPLTGNMVSSVPVVPLSYTALGEWIRTLDALPQRLLVIRDMYAQLCEQIGRSA